jgi:Ran GTPase-activating protein (RanGAP) involved in mRNA processing and transport
VLYYNLGNEGAKHLASLLTNNSTLQYLDLSAVDIQDNGLAVIILALQKNNSLTHLNLQNNNISDKSFTLLSDLLQTNKGLTYLSLRALNLGDNGVSILSKGLSANQTLTALDLQNNKIDNTGFFAILNAVNKTNLEHLYFQWNNIRNCDHVLGFIPSSKLLSVNLQGNKKKDEEVIWIDKEIAKLAKERK